LLGQADFGWIERTQLAISGNRSVQAGQTSWHALTAFSTESSRQLELAVAQDMRTIGREHGSQPAG
jgi:hypothetical protein